MHGAPVLDRSMRPGTLTDQAADASFSICRNENPSSHKPFAQDFDTLDPFESAKSHFFDTSNWGPFCDVTLTLKQGCRSDSGAWVKINDYRCRQAFRHFMNLLNRAIYGAAFRRHRKRLRVLPVLERGEIRARALRSWERGTSGRWHIHCAIELPSHFDAIALEGAIHRCWEKVEWGYGRILVRDCANAGWIHYMLKDRQKSEFEGLLDCVVIESLHNPNADA